jgi:hypothetical protein
MILATLASALIPLTALSADITDKNLAPVPQRAEMLATVGVSAYGRENPSYPPYPTQLRVSIIGLGMSDRKIMPIPGTTMEYYPGFLFEGRLESLDGSISVRFRDNFAARLKLPDGSLIVKRVTTTLDTGEQIDTAAIDAVVNLPLALSEALFGPNVRRYNDGATLRLRNLGTEFVIGFGNGHAIQNAVVVHSLEGSGPVETGGTTGQVSITSPEPCVVGTTD